MSGLKPAKRIRVLSTKVTEKDNCYMQIMVNRYYEEGRIKQAKTSTLLRLIVKRFLRRDCPEYEQKISTSYQQEINKLYSAPKDDTRFPQSYQLRKTNYTPGPSTANTASAKRSTSYADLMRQL
ncbi:MAG: hypothetical protein M3530_03315 [Thermoproteota archaeon]|nr:hypothetical protein [Thermoproteota archaeon]